MSCLSHQSKYRVASLEALENLARTLSEAIQPGDVVALNGPLGAGKTTFVQQLGAALGVSEAVTSPTFVLMHEYLSGRLPVVHVDLYRLGPERAAGFADELLAIIDEGRSLVLVEWAEYGEFLDTVSTVAVDIAFAQDGELREFSIRANRPLLPQGFPLELEP